MRLSKKVSQTLFILPAILILLGLNFASPKLVKADGPVTVEITDSTMVDITNQNYGSWNARGTTYTTFSENASCIQDASFGEKYRALVKFSMANIPQEAQVQSANLTFTLQCWEGSSEVNVGYLGKDWQTSTVGWGVPWSSPGVTGINDSTNAFSIICNGGPTGRQTFNVALDPAKVQSWINNQNYGLIYRPTPPDAKHTGLVAQADPNLAQRPKLTITYSNVNNPAPQVALTAPLSEANFTEPASIQLEAAASDDGAITKVEFFANNQKIGEDLTAPYAFNWNNVNGGFYGLTAKAYDNFGATTISSAVNISVTNVNDPPLISNGPLATPNPALVNSAVTFSVSANDPDGDALNYLWNFGDGTTGNSPSVNHTYLSPGTYNITVNVTDPSNATVSGNLNLLVSQSTGQPVTVEFVQGVNNYSGVTDFNISNTNIGSWNNFNGSTYTTGNLNVMEQVWGSTIYRSVLKFDNLSLPPGAIITEAKLKLRATTWASGANQIVIRLRKFINPWNINGTIPMNFGWRYRNTGLTWGQDGALAEGVDVSGTAVDLSGFTESGDQNATFNLDPQMVQDWVNNPTNNWGMMMHNLTSGKTLSFYSSENSTVTNRPKLSVTYVMP